MDECNKHCTSVADDPARRPPAWKEDLVNVRNSWLREKRKVTDFYSDDNYDKKGTVLYLLAVTFEYPAKLTVFHPFKFSGRLKGGNVKHISEHLATPTKDELMAFVAYSIQAYWFDIDSAEKPFTKFDGDEHLQKFRPIPECTKTCDQIIKAVQFIKFPPSVGFYHLGIQYLKTYHRAFRALYIFQLLSNLPTQDKRHYDIQYSVLYPNRLDDTDFKMSFYTKQHYLKVALQFHKNDQRLICQLMPSYLSIDDWDAAKKSLSLNDLCDIYEYTAVEDVDYPEFDPDAASQKMPSKQTTSKEVATPPKANGNMSEMSTPGTDDVLKEAKAKNRKKKKGDDTLDDKLISKKSKVSKVDTNKPLSSDDEDDLPIKPTASKKNVVTFPRLTEGKTKEERCELSVTYSSPGVDDVVRVADKDCSLKSVRNFLQTKGKYKSYAKKEEIPQHLRQINNFKGIEGVDPRRLSYWPTNLLKMYKFANYGNIPAAVNDPLVCPHDFVLLRSCDI
eukprot:scaffold20111_cov46-Cyclotella_meneghiniana.AAC.4